MQSTERKRAPLAELAATESTKRRRVAKSPGSAAKAAPETSSVMTDAMTLGLTRREVLASFRRLVRANPSSEITLHMVLADLAAAEDASVTRTTPVKPDTRLASSAPVSAAAPASPGAALRTPAKQIMSKDAAATPCSPPVCSICLDPLDGRARFTTECSHTFHFACIKEAVEKNNRSCPLCRKSFEEMLPPTTVPPPSAASDGPNWAVLLQALLSARVQALMSTQSTMRSISQRADGEMSPTPDERRSASARRADDETSSSAGDAQNEAENGSFLFLRFLSPSEARRRRGATEAEPVHAAALPARASTRSRRRRVSEPRLTDASTPIGTLLNWEMVDSTHARGEIVGHPIFPDNRMMTTAAIVERRGDLVRTINDSIYRLGNRASTA